jgi:hexosaminidase
MKQFLFKAVVMLAAVLFVSSFAVAQSKISKPVSSLQSGTYIGNQKVTLTCKDKSAKIFYTIDGKEPGEKSLQYLGQFTLSQSTIVKAVAISKRGKSDVMVLNFEKIDNVSSLKFTNPPSPKFKLKNPYSLLENNIVSQKMDDGTWYGFEGKDAEVIINFDEMASISEVSLSMMQNKDSGIYFPNAVEVFVSPDGKSFFSAGFSSSEKFDKPDKFYVDTFKIQCKLAATKTLKVVIKNRPLTESNKAGKKSWLLLNKLSYK